MLTVGTPLVITADPIDYTGPVNSTASFTVAAAGENLTYRWEYRTSENGAWTPVSAASGKTANYSLTVKARHDGYQYRCAVSDGNAIAYSDIATLTVAPALAITSQPSNQIVTAGQTATFAVTASGAGALSYQWKYRTPTSGEWTDVSAASGKTATYSLTAKARHDGYQYKCVVTDGAAVIESSVVTLIVG